MDFEAELEAFYRRLPLAAATVIDVGAHTGRHAIPLAHQVGPRGIVHAFEPIPSIRSQLVANTVAAGANNVVVYPFALADATGPARFHYVPNLPGESGLRARHSYNAEPEPAELIEVPTYRLDELGLGEGAAFLKVDIEGGELDMLRGAAALLARARPVVAFECGAAAFLGYHDQPQELYQLLCGLGYSIHSILGHGIADAAAFRDATFAQTFWDYVAIPAEKSELAQLLPAR